MFYIYSKNKKDLDTDMNEVTKCKIYDNIFLIGFMAVGKTSIGRNIANLLNVRFLDLDTEIQISEGKDINAIFSDFGEAYFREKEKLGLHNSVGDMKKIIAVGGGVPCFQNNMEFMLSHGVVVFLEMNFADIEGRLLKIKKNHRPLVNNYAKYDLKYLYDQRLSHYIKAHYTIQIGALDTIEDISNKVVIKIFQ